MKTEDAIEASAEPLDVILPLDDLAEMQEFYGNWAPYEN